MDNVLRGSGTHFPRWMRWTGMGTGIFLLADGMRRLFAGGGDLSGVFAYILIGTACIYIAGYEKKIFLSEKGFEREILFWGRGRKEQVLWMDMEELILVPSGKGTAVLIPLKQRGWRAFFPGIREDDVGKFVARFREDLPVRKGSGS